MIKGFGPNSDMGYVHCAFIAPPHPQKTNKKNFVKIIIIKDHFLNFQNILKNIVVTLDISL